MNTYYSGVLEEKYALESSADPYVVLERIAQSRHCLLKGSGLDTEKAAMLMLDDFRSGRLGRLTLEYPAEGEK